MKIIAGVIALLPASAMAATTLPPAKPAAVAAITSGAINGATIGATTPASGSFTSVRAQNVPLTSQNVTAYTFALTDCGTVVRFLPTAAATVTVPTGLPIGCEIKVTQVNSAGPVTFAAGAGEAIRSYNGATTTNGQYAVADIVIDSAASFELSGQVH